MKTAFQDATDIFMGWTTNHHGQHFYVRQLRDTKIKPALESMDVDTFKRYARAYVKTGDAVILKGYMRADESFENAISKFGLAYANQNEKDYQSVLSVVKGTVLKAK